MGGFKADPKRVVTLCCHFKILVVKFRDRLPLGARLDYDSLDALLRYAAKETDRFSAVTIAGIRRFADDDRRPLSTE